MKNRKVLTVSDKRALKLADQEARKLIEISGVEPLMGIPKGFWGLRYWVTCNLTKVTCIVCRREFPADEKSDYNQLKYFKDSCISNECLKREAEGWEIDYDGLLEGFPRWARAAQEFLEIGFELNS